MHGAYKHTTTAAAVAAVAAVAAASATSTAAIVPCTVGLTSPAVNATPPAVRCSRAGLELPPREAMLANSFTMS